MLNQCSDTGIFPTDDGRFLLDTDASLFAVGGVLNQMQGDREVVIAYASRSLRLSQRRYCTTRREIWRWWLCAHISDRLPTIPVLGAGTMGRTSQGSPSVDVLPPHEGAVLPDGDSVKSAGSFSGARSDRPEASGMDVSSAALSSAV